MLLDSASAFIATVGEDHTLVLPESVPTGSRVAVVIIEPVRPLESMPMTAPVQELINETQEDAWELLLELIRTAPSGRFSDASENHDKYLYGDRL